MRVFIGIILCFLTLATGAFAQITIQGVEGSFNVSIGDTLMLSNKKYLKVGEHFVRWEIVSGSGTFFDATEIATADSTGFIPSSSSAVLRLVADTLPIYKITDKSTVFYYDSNSTKIPNGNYGIRMYFNSGESRNYVLNYKFNQRSFGIGNYTTDSTFTSIAPRLDGASVSGKHYFTTEPNSKSYIFFFISINKNYYQVMHDSTVISVQPVYTIEASASGNGTAEIDSSGTKVTSYSRFTKGESRSIYATADNDNKFDHWEVTSGSCTITDTKKASTKVTSGQGDCKIRAVFKEGIIYTITNVPTEYDFLENSYAPKVTNGYVGVRFTFKAPSDGDYSIIVSNSRAEDSIFYLRYTDTDYKTLSAAVKFLGTYADTRTLTKDQVVSVIIYRPRAKSHTFYINYSLQSYKLSLNAGANGMVLPDSGYAKAFSGTKYSITAEADSGYRFSDWKIVSGTPVIDNSESPFTYVTISGNSELMANFKPSSIYKLNSTKQTFNFQKNYYHESSRSAIRFTWTPPDTAYYLLRFETIDSMGVFINNYAEDSLFATIVDSTKLLTSKTILFKGNPNTPYYWSVRDTSMSIPNTSFKLWVSTPYVLNVSGTKGGSVNPSGATYTRPNDKIILTAWTHGGYVFDSWEVTGSNSTIANKNEARTSIVQKDSICSVKAIFVEDDSATAQLSISNLDLTNYPEICAHVTVTDLHSGHTFYGLGAEDLAVTQDGRTMRSQVTSINTVSGISVVIVVDESGSMTTNDRIGKAKESIKNFIDEMSPYDRTAIVGFHGKDSTTVHQRMTSNKSLLYNAVDELNASGNTNLVTGTQVGLEQIVNETNPTMVIVFSDGDNDASDNLKVDATIALAKSKKTTIHTIGLETSTRNPLEKLAKGTGGIFTFANDASELAGIYAAMRDNTLSQYVVCYQAPTSLENGESHEVVVGMMFHDSLVSDTIKWNEGFLPPTINLTDSTWNLIENSQEANTALTISAYIKSGLKITSAKLYMKQSGTDYASFTSYSMTHVRDSLWEYTIPENLVIPPGIDFYIIATDSLGQTGKTPKILTPGMEPYTIFIENDIPDIAVFSVACEDTSTNIKTFAFRISDSDGIEKATLYYRNPQSIFFQDVPLAYSIQNDTWVAEIPAPTSVYSHIDYYLRVTDLWGAAVRTPRSGYSITDACEIKTSTPPEDSVITGTDTIPEDTVEFTWRDSIEYSLIADSAEILDKDLDGKADFVRIHFKEERDDNVESIDSVFWNSNRGERRYVPIGTTAKNRDDGKWIEGYLNSPYKYGLTAADPKRIPFLSFSTIHSDKTEYVKLTDRIGAVPVKAIKRHSKVDLEKYMDPASEPPMDSLIIIMSEPITKTGGDDAWDSLFFYSKSCEDTALQPLNIKDEPKISENGLQWTIPLDDHTLKVGYCLTTNPKAPYQDSVGNSMGLGGITVEGMDGSIYLTEIKPLQTISGIGQTPEWIPPNGSRWEDLPDSLSAISVRTLLPYTAEIYIFDAISVYATHFEQKFGFDGEMNDPERDDPKDHSKLGFLYWNQRAKNGRKVGSGVYIWKILFTFEDGHKETIIVKTGIKR